MCLSGEVAHSLGPWGAEGPRGGAGGFRWQAGSARSPRLYVCGHLGSQVQPGTLCLEGPGPFQSALVASGGHLHLGGSGFHLEVAQASLLDFLDVWHLECGNRVGLGPTLSLGSPQACQSPPPHTYTSHWAGCLPASGPLRPRAGSPSPLWV